MNRGVTMSLMVLALAAAAQPARAQDTIPADDPVRAEHLRQLIEERFAERLSQELGLSDDQAARVRGILATWATRRRGMEKEERRLRQALALEMRPGVAANPDSVTRSVDAIMNGRLAYIQTFKDELKDLSTVLSPIQRGQYVLLRDRLLQRIQDVRAQRQLQPIGPRRNRRVP